MAQTRATSKACRLAFSWIMHLAGYSVTPAEEMTFATDSKPAPNQPRGNSFKKEQAPQSQPPAKAQKVTISLNDIANIADTIEVYKLDKERVKADVEGV